MLLAALLADAGDDGALDAADDVGAVVELLDRGDHIISVGVGRVRLHHYDHGVIVVCFS